MRNPILYSTVLAAFLTFPTPVLAQDGSEGAASRTPENAQLFLSKVAEQYPIQLTPKSFNWSSDIGWVLTYRPVRISAQGRCITRFEGDVYQFRAKDDAGEWVNPNLDPTQSVQLVATRSDLVAKYKLKTSPYLIDWSKVTYLGKMQAEPYNESSKSWAVLDGTVTIAMGDAAFTLFPPDKELAARMLLAAQTLKQACDVTEGLGF